MENDTSLWDGLFSGAMLVSGRVSLPVSFCSTSVPCYLSGGLAIFCQKFSKPMLLPCHGDFLDSLELIWHDDIKKCQAQISSFISPNIRWMLQRNQRSAGCWMLQRNHHVYNFIKSLSFSIQQSENIFIFADLNRLATLGSTCLQPIGQRTGFHWPNRNSPCHAFDFASSCPRNDVYQAMTFG